MTSISKYEAWNFRKESSSLKWVKIRCNILPAHEFLKPNLMVEPKMVHQQTDVPCMYIEEVLGAVKFKKWDLNGYKISTPYTKW